MNTEFRTLNEGEISHVNGACWGWGWGYSRSFWRAFARSFADALDEMDAKETET